MIQVEIRFPINPFRGDKFAEGWLPAAEAVLDFGATQWSFVRALDGRLDFVQTALFPSKAHWEQYWYSERIAVERAASNVGARVIELPAEVSAPWLADAIRTAGALRRAAGR